MNRRVSKNNRVLAVIAVMAAASFVVGGLVYAVSNSENQSIDVATGRVTAIRASTAALTSAIETEHLALDEYVLSGNSLARQPYLDSVAAEARHLAELRALALDDPRILTALDELEAVSLDWRVRVALPALAAVTIGDATAIGTFSKEAFSNHVVVDDAIRSVAIGAAAASDDIADRKSALEPVKLVGIALAFGFLAVAFGVALMVVRRFGRALERDAEQAGVLNRFTELTSFATDDREVAAANLAALGRLVKPDASVTHILNASLDRAIPEASSGEAIAEVLPLHALSRCAGIVRGTMYVTDDLSDALSVHCPVFPAGNGTLACIPLISGESVGAVHLYWHRPAAFPLDLRASVARITEHAALAIGNRRLLTALHGQANTDARTGLVNSRSFDASLEAALVARTGEEALSVLMLDVDQFKKFNDRHGHPAGDEALRAFAGVLRSCMREADVAARYGGEEFAVFLPGIGPAAAAAIAERIRARTESTIISLAPGLTDRITISIGIATAPGQASDRASLLRLADEALYRAKANGRNRVVGLGVGARRAAIRAAAPVAAPAVTPEATPVATPVTAQATVSSIADRGPRRRPVLRSAAKA
jgi:diguanylate cyclase (GGDEF)-like protein